jgi:hypothetical protein
MKTQGVEAFPLQWPEGWPRTPVHMRTNNSRLRTVSFDTARREMERELALLGAKNVVLSTNMPLRQDGKPYSHGRVMDGDPGVAIYFTLRDRPMVMARDAYTVIAQNMRSLGLAVEYLRGLERHGGAHMMERAFAGFAALPPPEGSRSVEVDWRREFNVDAVMSGLDASDLLAIVDRRYKAQVSLAREAGDQEREIILNAAIERARAELKP